MAANGGDVGIGTSTPTKKLTVHGGISASLQLYGGLNNTTTNNIVFYNTVGGELTYGTAGNIGGGLLSSSAQIASDISGAFLGLGLLSSSAQIATDISGAFNGVTGSFLLNTTDTLTGDLTVTNNITASGNISSSGTGLFGDDVTIISGSLIIDTTTEGISFAGNGASSTNKIQYTSADNLQFDFDGNAQFINTDVDITAGADLMLRNSNNTNTMRLTNAAAAGTGAGRIDVQSGTTTKVSITGSNDGRIGIGTTTPKKALHVENSGILIDGASTLDGTGFTERFIIDAGASTAHTFLKFKNDNGGQLTVTGAGNVSASGTLHASLADSSDTSFKTVMYDTATGQFFRTGSYGGGGGGGGADNLGNHTATQDLEMDSNKIISSSNIMLVADGFAPGTNDNVIIGASTGFGTARQFRIFTNEGDIRIGHANTSFCHFVNSTEKMYFKNTLANASDESKFVFDGGDASNAFTGPAVLASFDTDLILRRDHDDTGVSAINQIKIGNDTLEIKLDSDIRFAIATNGDITINDPGNSAGDFITISGGVLKKRTASDVLGDISAVDSVTSGDANTITVGGTAADPTISAVTAAVSNGSLNLVTGDAVHSYALAISSTDYVGEVKDGAGISIFNQGLVGGGTQAEVSFDPGGSAGELITSGDTSGGSDLYESHSTLIYDGTDLQVHGGDIIAFYSSDKRLKDNVTPISNPIKKILQIGGYTFDWNEKQDTYKGHDVGVIAQEIEKVLPEVVETRENGYKAVKYQKIVPLLIEAIKDQQKQIDELKNLIKNGNR